MLNTSRWILRVLNWLNWGVGLVIILFGLIAGFVLHDQLVAALAADGLANATDVLLYLRVAFPLTAPMVWLVHVIITRLTAIIDSISDATVFSLINAARLRAIALALLGTQVIDLIAGLIAIYVSERTGEYFGWSIGITGWIAALMLFILARVFREGAAMREELEGTV